MGPWTRHDGNLACIPSNNKNEYQFRPKKLSSFYGEKGSATPGQGCLYNGSTDISTTKAQQNFVIEIKYDEDNVERSMFVWTGDLWQQAHKNYVIQCYYLFLHKCDEYHLFYTNSHIQGLLILILIQ